jgi:nucleoside 2-deoxyribosyltransferase
LIPPDVPPQVYLAAPFFSLADRWLVETCRSVLLGLGAEVFSPLHDVGPGGYEVAKRHLDGLDRSDAVLALLDGWDPGTVYEVGWAHRKGLPVVGFLQGPAHEGTKMLVGTGAELHQDLSSALYRSVWAGQGHRSRRAW